MFGKSEKQRLKDYNELMAKKKKKNADQLMADIQPYLDFNQSFNSFNFDDYDFGDPEEVDESERREIFEHIIDIQDIQVNDEPNLVEETVQQPLFEGSPNSVTEFAMALMAFARKQNETDASMNMILDLFRIFLPESNKVPSYAKIKSIVNAESRNSLVSETAIICANCLKDICECGSVDKTILLTFNTQFQLEGLLTSYQDYMDKYRTEMLSKTDFMDIHQSEYYRVALQKCPNMLPISLYADGGRYTKTGAYEGWPLIGFVLDLPPKLRHKYSNIIFYGYWYSKKKPNWEFIFQKIGPSLRFSFNAREYRVRYLQVIADIPARQHLLSMINVNGYNSCFNCNIRGEHKGHMVFPYAEIHPRDPKTFIDQLEGVQGPSVLYERIVKFPQGVVIDIMHSVYRGPVEDDLKRLIKGFKRNPNERLLIKLSPAGLATLDSILTTIKFPKEYQRKKIRSLSALATWKASELKLFCLYVVPTVLLFVASSESPVIAELVESMIIHSSAIRILTQSKISIDMVTTASEVLHFWAKNRQRLWTHSAMTFKCHENLHLPNQVLLHGPLSTHSAFAGESVIGKIGENITCYNMEVSAKQIAERMALRRACFFWLEKYGTQKLKNYFNDNHILQTTRRPEPIEEIVSFLSHNLTQWQYRAEVTISGFSISSYRNSDSANCYVAVKTETGFKAIKVMSIIENSSKEILFCAYPIKVIPYSQLMNGDGFLASKPFAYELCCYCKDDDAVEDELLLCNTQSFLAKYVFIRVPNYAFLITIPHPYEHN